MNSEKAFKNTIAEYLETDPQRITLFWKGRVSLYALLKAMGVGPGDEVILPAYTCVVVPNAILYCGAIPRYVDIDCRTYCADSESIGRAITSKTKAIICQNTYGLSADVDRIAELAKSKEIWTIEDCTHGFGGHFKGKPNGSYCDAAFYSTQWNKPFSTGIGGFSLVNTPSLQSSLTKLIEHFEEPSLMDELNLRLLYWVKDFLLHDFTYWPLLRAYRYLSSHNLVLGSSDKSETTNTDMPMNFKKLMSPTQAQMGVRMLNKFKSRQAQRKENARIITEYLRSNNKNHVPLDLFLDHGFCKYPLMVENRTKFIEKAISSRIAIGDWFLSPLHPVMGDLRPWGFDAQEFPVAVRVAERVVNVPVVDVNIERVIKYLNENLDLIMDNA